MLFAFWLMSLKSKCSTARHWFQYYFFSQNSFLKPLLPARKRARGIKIGIFDPGTAFSHKLTLQKHFKSFCTASNGEHCTVVNLRSCHRMALVFCSCCSYQVCSLCVSDHAWRKAREVRLHTDFFLFPFFFQWFLFPLHWYISPQACLTALCLQTSHPQGLSKAIWQRSQPRVDFRRKFSLNFLLVNSYF